MIFCLAFISCTLLSGSPKKQRWGSDMARLVCGEIGNSMRLILYVVKERQLTFELLLLLLSKQLNCLFSFLSCVQTFFFLKLSHARFNLFYFRYQINLVQFSICWRRAEHRNFILISCFSPRVRASTLDEFTLEETVAAFYLETWVDSWNASDSSGATTTTSTRGEMRNDNNLFIFSTWMMLLVMYQCVWWGYLET